MKPPYYDNDLIQTLQLSGEYIGQSDHPENHADWVLFLVDEIKSQVKEEEYAAMLQKLNSSVSKMWEEEIS